MMNNTMRRSYLKTAILLFALSISAAVHAQQKGEHKSFLQVDSNVVWHAPVDFMTMFHRTCDSLEGQAFQRCFLNLMKKSGATAEAVRFTILTDTTGYVRHFVDSGIVDIAYVFYPFRANENFGITLVNGKPDMIDVDDFSFVDLAELKKDSTYIGIVDSFPDAAVWPGDRYHLSEPRYESLPGGGERFIVQYILKNACHACRDIGVVDFAFDFNRDGTFEGTRLLRVVPIAR